jgi:hypothetical protein
LRVSKGLVLGYDDESLVMMTWYFSPLAASWKRLLDKARAASLERQENHEHA